MLLLDALHYKSNIIIRNSKLFKDIFRPFVCTINKKAYICK